MPIRRKAGEKKDEFVARCIAKEVSSGMKEDQAAAVCYAYWEDRQLKAIKNMRKANSEKWIEKFFQNNDIGVHMSELGLTEEDFEQAQKFEVDVENFAISKDDATDATVDYYRYETRVDAKGHKAERPFCKNLMAKTNAGLLFRFEDIVAMNNDGGKADRAGGKGYSVFKYRGGVHCKHVWVKYKYVVGTGELVKGGVQPSSKPVGYVSK